MTYNVFGGTLNFTQLQPPSYGFGRRVYVRLCTCEIIIITSIRIIVSLLTHIEPHSLSEESLSAMVCSVVCFQSCGDCWLANELFSDMWIFL